MKKRFAAVFATLSIAALTAAGASEFGRHPAPALYNQALDAATIDVDAVPVPVSGTVSQMFAVAFGDNKSCLTRDDVVAQLSGQAKAFGGGSVVEELMAVQTPQAFRAPELLAAYRRAAADDFTGTDTAACLERYTDLPVAAVASDRRNLKITFPEDVTIAERLLSR